MASPLKFSHLGKSVILFRSNRARSNSKALSSLLFSRGFNSLLRNDPTNAFVGFHRNGRRNFLPCCFGGSRSFRGGGDEIEMKKGDWNCPECNFHNFARNIRCLKCKADGPRQVDVSNAEMKPGDWNCPQCQFMNFARNTSCKRCREPRSVTRMGPGDWKCPACDFVNFSRNMSCLKCNKEGPKDAERTEVASPYDTSLGSEDNVERNL